MKKTFCLIFALIFVLAAFCSCGADDTTEQKSVSAAELDGVWVLTEKLDDASELKAKLLKEGFFEKELDFLDVNKIGAVKLFTVSATGTDSGTYSYSYDKEATYVLLTVAMEDYISKCFENIGELREYYTDAIVDEIKSLDDFKKFYCSNFSCSNYDELINKLCALIFNSSLYSGTVDEGDFTLDDNMLYMKKKVEADYVSLDETQESAKAEQVGASLKDNSLTLSYKSGTETYTKR